MRISAFAALLLLASCARPAAESARPAETRTPQALASAAPAIAVAGNPAVGGVVLPTDTLIADGLTALPVVATFVRAVTTAGTAETLRAAGPFTVFAPTDAAFGRLQPGTVDALLKPENRASLSRLIGLHIVAERLTGVDLMRRVQAGGGRATLTSLAGEPLTVTATGGVITLTDAGGNRSYVETADIRQANGIVHVVNGVLVPRLD